MNAFESARGVEARSMEILQRFLEEREGWKSRYVLTNKGVLARHLQEIAGDLLFNDASGTLWAVECKAEENANYGNFFLESWSNRNLEQRDNHAMHGSNPGWMWKSRADLLFYHFLAEDDLYVVPFFKLKQWAFGCGKEKGRIYEYPERLQGKRIQRNDTWGRCVPIRVIERDVGLKLIHPKQLNLFDGSSSASRPNATTGTLL